MTPKTTKEAATMVSKGWLWLAKKYPAVLLPLTLWMLFGGGIFLYNYTAANKIQIKEAQPISQVVQPKAFDFSIVQSAYAGIQPGNPIIFNGQLWGYEDTTLTVKAVKDSPLLLVYDKKTKRVYQVEFGDTFQKSLK